MPKASKSSASSGTRKKHARKASAPPLEALPPQKSKSKPSKKEIKKGLAPPPKKSYIAPSKLKPLPVQIDPLDSLGLATVLPPDIVVVFRRLAKKDTVTKARALEELGAWVKNTREETVEVRIASGQLNASLDILVSALPVWLYRYPALSIHPSRRIRYLSALLHASLFQILTLRSAILTVLLETGSETQVSQVLGAWCLSAWDVDRGVATVSSRSWKEVVSAWPDQSDSLGESESKQFILDDSTLTRSLLPFILTTVMDPDSTYSSLIPSHSTALGDSPSSSRTSLSRQVASSLVVAPPASVGRHVLSTESSSTPPAREDDESTEDRRARLRVGAMGALKWILDTYPPTPPLVTELRLLLLSPAFWSVLHYAAQPPFLEAQIQSQELGDIAEPPFAISGIREGFGSGQTIVRRAGWNILCAIMKDSGMGVTHLRWIDNVSEANASGLLPSAILRSAFVEPDPVVRSSMWEPLLVSLTKLDNAWMLNFDFEIAGRRRGNLGDDGSESSATEDNMDPSASKGDSTVHAASSVSGSIAYVEFLAFLALGCNGSPIQGYPTVLVILSTIPPEILPLTLPALSEFFDALWAAIDGRALSVLAPERTKATDAFLGAWGECLLWTAGKLIKSVNVPSDNDLTVPGDTSDLVDLKHHTDQESSVSIARALVRMQFRRLTEQLGAGLRVDASVIGRRAASVLRKLEQIDTDLFAQAWTPVSSFEMTMVANTEDSARRDDALAFLAALHQHLPPGLPRQDVERLVISIAIKVVTSYVSQSLPQGEPAGDDHHIATFLTVKAKVLEKIMDEFEQVLNENEEFVNHIDELLRTKIISLLSQPLLILSYLTHRSDITRTIATWRLLLSVLGSSTDVDLNIKLRVLDVLLNSAQLDGPTSWAKPQGGELDGLAGYSLIQALDGDGVMLNLTEKLLKRSGSFLDPIVADNMVSTILATIETHSQSLLRDPSALLKPLRSTLNLVLALERESATMLCASAAALDAMPWVFLLAFVLPECSPTEEESYVLDLSRQVWETWRELATEDVLRAVSEEIKDALRKLVADTDVRPRPASLLQAFSHVNRHVTPLLFSEILPTQSDLDILLASTSADPIDSALAVIQPLAPSVSSSSASSRPSWNHSFDGSGFSPYARSVSCLLYVMTTDRKFARENVWALHHVLILALFASEVLQAPGVDSPVFRLNPTAAETELRDISRQTQQIAAFLLIVPSEESWHKEVVGVLSMKSPRSERFDSIGAFVKLVFEVSLRHGTVRDSFVLHTVLQYILRSATKDDADLWIELARGLEEKVLQTSLAISLAVTEFAPEPPKLDRYRNELASKVAGISPSKANTTGLRLLRCLSAVAPDPESDVIFLPQQRAVYLVQALQTWMTSDEDLLESVENEITLVLFHLAPILQNVQGAHWEFIMDIIESNIENSSLKNADTLVLLSRSLRLLTTIQDLSVSNKYLRQLWAERSKVVLTMVRDLLAAKVDRSPLSVPRAVCRGQALSIVQDLPGSLMDEATLSTMCHLLTDSSVDVQKMAYQLLQQAAIKRTEYLVIEAGVDSDAVIELPPELIALLQSTIDIEGDAVESNVSGQDPLAYLLGWMILFDLFTDASLRVKTAYIDHLRNLDVIGEYFLPNIFELLGLGREGQKPFKLDAWSVDEYWITFYDAGASQSLRLLAAHLYYRALLTVPSLIRTWWDELKNRQLLAAVTSYTSSHFSPVLVTAELMHVKPSSTASVAGEESLIDDSFNVKVALVVREVTATFNVDDQQMEIGVRLPAEYPLRPVEVRDIRRVGVPEKLWRKWLFAVQQVVTSQNGRIVDALSLFKRNVSLHFEGQVECAICYSIISVMDRSLPAKPCKTCKNRFHASCLYKWFNTSHSSSCPLCRSDIM